MKLFKHLESKVLYEVKSDAPMVMEVITNVLPPRGAKSFVDNNKIVQVFVKVGAEYVGKSVEEAKDECIKGLKHEIYGEILYDLQSLSNSLAHVLSPNNSIRKDLEEIINKVRP